MDYVWYYTSPLGRITMASDGCALTGLWFEQQKYYADTLSGNFLEMILPVFQQTKKWLDIYFNGKKPDFTPPLMMKTTPFRKEVLKIVLAISYGQTMSYGKITEQIIQQKGCTKMSAQAVGGAVSHNPISLIIPCHRVVGSNNKLTGYAGGVDRKIKLLELEKSG